MNLSKLFQLQQTLDKRIINEHDLHDKSLFSKKVLALQVEVSELANETRCFKFWSNKGPSNRDTILEEYVDCLHFILSLGLEKNYQDIQLSFRDDYNDLNDLTETFINVYIDINDFVVCTSKDNYKTLFEDFLCLGKSLGFTAKDIENAYLQKNNVNHKRQDIGY
ncbi:dUTP diphosphatase [Clostridium ganghwense]|uniref:dUTP diphosphatase n=1 Tax=Clostridium ganghwense TaxID=312089 RepID=A0ABT4CT23_9CLOT|nr:dUTP diphosphatase [Clostridium ganghwense]MCY6372078.1 dUTP diphosphatase [Clostridium ganghwense]